jgi:hypothetical protein
MCLVCYQLITELAQWDAAYVNDLPDAAFAVIEPDYVMGRTRNKNARHLPHHSVGVKNGRNSKDLIDQLHLENALTRIELIVPVTSSISRDELIKRAKSHLIDHAADLDISKPKEVKKETKDLVFKPSNVLIESLSERGFNINSAGMITERIDGTLLSVDSSNIHSDEFQARLAERQENQRSVDYFKPKPEDYITAEYRALSKSILRRRFLDFTKGNVLKKSAKMLTGATFFPDHNAITGNYIGKVEKSYWDENSNLPGMNAKAKIDIFADPKITRGILGEILNRVSVNVWFQWEKSHDLDDYEFMKLLGSKLDDDMVRFIVTQIEGYGEMSLVWFGADPTAKQIGKVKVGS